MELVIQIHLWASLIALPIGAFQLLRKKGGTIHRRIGYVFVFCMAAANLTALMIYQITGGPNLFHFFALLNLFTVGMALTAAVRRKTPDWLIAHYFWICYAYLGLLAASINEVFAHVAAIHRPVVELFAAGGITGTNVIWAFTAVNMFFTFGIGSWLIRRNVPSVKRPA